MPAFPRKELFFPNEIGFYHCYSRCVQQEFLCGMDRLSGEDFSYRQDWIECRTAMLASVFAMDVLDIAILGNHMHHVVRNRPDLRDSWTDLEVARRWLQLRRMWTRKVESVHLAVDEAKVIALASTEQIGEYRRRLGCLSWFMKELKEPISRWANAESDKAGHFWDERFRSTRLLDEAAVFACSLYVDLNVIRAGVAETPEDSRYTSAWSRIRGLMQLNGTPMDDLALPAQRIASCVEAAREENEASANDGLDETNDVADESTASDRSTRKRGTKPTKRKRKTVAVRADAWLAPIHELGEPDNLSAPEYRASNLGFLPITVVEYLDCLDWCGRQPRSGKSAIPSDLATIWERLGINVDSWSQVLKMFSGWFPRAIGSPAALEEEASRRGLRWLKGIGRCRSAFT